MLSKTKYGKDLKSTIKSWLEHRPEFRDDDFKLIARVWRRDALYLHTHGSITYQDYKDISTFLHLFEKGVFSHFESIRRVRAKLQESYPALRGKRYGLRKEKLNDDVKEQIINWHNPGTQENILEGAKNE